MRIIIALIFIFFAVNSYEQVTTYSSPALKGCAAFGTDTSSVRKYLDYCRINQVEAYFPTGTYQFPENFQYDYGSVALKLRGDGKGKTIFTCSAAPMKYTERVNLSLPKTVSDGYYIADIVPVTLHTDWSALSGIAVHDYFKVVSGVASTTTQLIAAQNGYIPELDSQNGASEPAQDGKYVVSKISTNWGGGFAHDTLPFATTVRVLTGSIVKRTSGVWSRYNPGNGFEFDGDFYCEGISFRNLPFFVFTPLGTAANRTFELKNCEFSHCTRITGLETTGGGTGYLLAGWDKKPGGIGDNNFAGFSWQSYEVSDCDFSNILTSIMWWISPAKHLHIKNNYITDCFTFISGFQHTVYSPILLTSTLVSDNHFRNCRGYNGAYTVDRELIKSVNISMSNNQFLLCNGLQVFATGEHNSITGNEFRMWNEMGSYYMAAVFLKGGVSQSTDLVEGNIFSGGGACYFIGIQKDQPISIRSNVFNHPISSVRTVESASTKVDVSLIYIVNDTTVFKTLAGSGYYTSPITLGGTYQFNYATQRWGTIGIPLAFPCILYTPVQDCLEEVTLANNTGEGTYYFLPTSTAYTLTTLRIKGDFVKSANIVSNVTEITNIEIDVTGTGAPSLNASPGSIYRRLDGGASTSIYIKETAKTDTTWEAK